MSWIKTIPYAAASGKLRDIYERVKGPAEHIDNILTLHSLRPHTLVAHMTMYKNVLHHSGNQLPKWLLEAVGVYVSLLNDCSYCVEHHCAGLKRLLKDDARAERIQAALRRGKLEETFSAREVSVLRYAERLTRDPSGVDETMIVALQSAGLDDGEILEVNQVVAYFAYANRTVLGLGVTTEGDILGLAPADSDDPEDWRHN